jgi:hypothetical protein
MTVNSSLTRFRVLAKRPTGAKGGGKITGAARDPELHQELPK